MFSSQFFPVVYKVKALPTSLNIDIENVADNTVRERGVMNLLTDC